MYRSILTKRPWHRIAPDGHLNQSLAYDSEYTVNESFESHIVTQSDFLRELHPSGHLIHSLAYYPNIFRCADIDTGRVDEEGEPILTRRYYEEKVPRIAFGFQRLIALKQTIHLCGNDVQFDATRTDTNNETNKLISDFRNGWLDKDMEVAFYRLVRSVKRIGDGAIVGYINNGVFEHQLLSYEDGDRLFPHYDNMGRLELFARVFNEYDDEGIKCRWVEIWDSVSLTRLKSASTTDAEDAEIVFLDKYSIAGYEIVEVEKHGFDRVPVAYKRSEDGPAWSDAQDLIDDYELSFSQMAQNNKQFGEPILVFRGDTIDCVPNEVTGTIKTISMDKDAEVSYLEAQSASESFMKQLETLYKMIFETTSTVIPPKDLKSGDLPAAALKILYSPAYEQAIEDTNLFSDALGDLVEIFKVGYGIEVGKLSAFKTMPLKFWLKPYVHVNWSAVVADLVALTTAGILSKQTASERASEYTTPDEFTRILHENEEKMARDLEQQILLSKATQTNNEQEDEGKEV